MFFPHLFSFPQFFLYVFSPGNIEFKKTSENLELRIRGVANFMTLLKILKKLEDVPDKSILKINFAGAKIIDLTVQEAIDDFKRNHELSGSPGSPLRSPDPPWGICAISFGDSSGHDFWSLSFSRPPLRSPDPP